MHDRIGRGVWHVHALAVGETMKEAEPSRRTDPSPTGDTDETSATRRITGGPGRPPVFLRLRLAIEFIERYYSFRESFAGRHA